MSKTVTPVEAHGWVDENLRARADLGFRKALASVVLEPSSPFDPQARRKLRTEFLILVLLATTSIACFLYFNVVR